jgi:hypothetical protein
MQHMWVDIGSVKTEETRVNQIGMINLQFAKGMRANHQLLELVLHQGWVSADENVRPCRGKVLCL